MKKSTIIISIVILAGIILFTFRGSITGNVIGSSNDFKISLSEISEQAVFYEQNGVRFFAIRAEDGSIKTAFDACDVCYSSNKGYRQEGDYMICNNCGNKYPISGLGTENIRGGGCWPGYLPSKIQGEYLVIKQKDINNGAYRF
tara:strand:+ start:5506 stop:5937 length:432 start_codon:yes stop_codon:yes gene_type:complete